MPDCNESGVSVVIPVYNGARYLAASVQSVLAQTGLPCEIVLVDDGSTDGSAALIQSLAASSPVPLRYVYQANQGTAAARNRGIEMASNPLIAFLDQDDLWLAEKLVRQCELLQRQPSAGYCVTHVESFLDEECAAVPSWVRATRLDGAQPAYLPSCLLVRQSALQQVGLFDPALRNGSDTDWFARARDVGTEVAVVPEIMVRYRIHNGNQSQFVRENQRDLYAVARKALLRKRLQGAAPTGQ